MTDRVRDYLQLRRESQAVFPGLFLRIREAVEMELAGYGARGVVGELDRETALRREPARGLATPYDWVAFGFTGYEFYDAHVGIVMNTRAWPCTCHVGFHRRSHLPAEIHERVEAVDWARALGSTPEHELIEATGEQQLRDTERPFDFSALQAEVTHFAGRACLYYRAAAAALSGAA